MTLRFQKIKVEEKTPDVSKKERVKLGIQCHLTSLYLLERRISWPTLDLQNQNLYYWGPQNLCFNKLSQWFWCMLTFEKHHYELFYYLYLNWMFLEGLFSTKWGCHPYLCVPKSSLSLLIQFLQRIKLFGQALK